MFVKKRTFGNLKWIAHNHHHYRIGKVVSPLPVKPEGNLGFRAVCLSFCPSVCPSVRPSVLLSVRLSCPSVCLSICLSVYSVSVPSVFPIFSQSSFEISTWNLVYDFVLTWYRSSLTLALLVKDQERWLTWNVSLGCVDMVEARGKVYG